MEDGGKAMPSPQQEEESVKKKIWRINAQEARFLRITNVPISTLLIGLWERVNLGQNAVLAVSMATSRAGAAEKEVPLYKHIADLAGKTSYHLPVPVFTLISGGNYAGNNLAFKEEGLES